MPSVFFFLTKLFAGCFFHDMADTRSRLAMQEEDSMALEGDKGQGEVKEVRMRAMRGRDKDKGCCRSFITHKSINHLHFVTGYLFKCCQLVASKLPSTKIQIPTPPPKTNLHKNHPQKIIILLENQTPPPHLIHPFFTIPHPPSTTIPPLHPNPRFTHSIYGVPTSPIFGNPDLLFFFPNSKSPNPQIPQPQTPKTPKTQNQQIYNLPRASHVRFFLKT